jgi:tRNA nucleotidyltransferase (CCA-adding enzyme)
LKTYLVGGAVRDRLLGRPVRERDWLVTDTTAEELRALGFQPVGRHFQVFLHPRTHEEYALPRGPEGTGVAGDLQRRDLTINALALGPDGELVDPCDGRGDLQRRLLRHTPAFREDPLRVLRLARFAARFHDLGFTVAQETRHLAREMARQGELDGLVPERVFAEIRGALQEPYPAEFFRVLRDLEALAIILPEVDRLFGIPQPARHHPEIDTGVHSLMVLQQACRLSPEADVRFAALVHDVGKGLTPVAEWPRHIGHESRGAELVDTLAQRLRIPRDWQQLARAAAAQHLNCHRALQLRPATVLKMLSSLDALRRPQRFARFLVVCEADMRGRTGFEDEPYPQARFMQGARDAAAAVDSRAVVAQCRSDKAIPGALRDARVQAIAAFRKRFAASPGTTPGGPPG